MSGVASYKALYFMAKITSLFLVFCIFSISLIPKLDIEELAKIPRLVSHFYEHSQADKHLDFVNFLAQHYQTDHKHNPEHEDLPFVSHHCATIAFVVSEISFHFISFISIILSFFSFATLHFVSIVGNTLLQPPKI
ncbi:MAG: hypothetical protein ACKVOU_03325 [Cytophagales bacterium]